MTAKTAEGTCPACAVPVYPGEDFCEACGHRLDVPVPACVACGATAIGADGYCEHCGLRQPANDDHAETETARAAGVTDRGRRHRRNEDAMALADSRDGVTAVVCDGVSSSSRPHEASRAAADAGVEALTGLLASGAGPEEATHTALRRAAEVVAGLATDRPEEKDEPPSCTYVSAVTGGEHITVGWVGDSRAYWLPATGGGTRLTDDDSWADLMVANGALTEEEAQAHPNAHVITAWLGADAGDPDPHVRTFRPDGPGALVVCSDGLWNYLPDAADLADAAPEAAAAPLETARSLTRLANDAGGRDNITVVVIPFSPSNQEHAS